MQQFQARRRLQRRVEFGTAAQPADVHERRAQALSSVEEIAQHVGRDVDSGLVEGADATFHDELRYVLGYRPPDAAAPPLEARIRSGRFGRCQGKRLCGSRIGISVRVTLRAHGQGPHRGISACTTVTGG